MLNHEELVALYKDHLDKQVLSIYIDGSDSGSARQPLWRRELDRGLGEALGSVSENGGGDGFMRARALLMKEIDGFDRELPGRGWIGFATADEVLYAEPVRATVVPTVRWEEGIRVAPYIRALKQDRPVVLALLDSQRARVFRWQEGKLSEPLDLRADTFVGDLSDIGMQKVPTQRSGVRGKTATDAAQTFLDVGSERLLKALVEDIEKRVGNDAVLVLGGTEEMVAAAHRQLPSTLDGRVVERRSFHFDMSGKELVDGIADAASELTQSSQNSLLEDVVEAAGASGRGSLGLEETLPALLEHRVDSLLISRSFIESAQDEADRCVGTAFGAGATVEELSGESGARLDEVGGGIGAKLRYRVDAA